MLYRAYLKLNFTKFSHNTAKAKIRYKYIFKTAKKQQKRQVILPFLFIPNY